MEVTKIHIHDCLHENMAVIYQDMNFEARITMVVKLDFMTMCSFKGSRQAPIYIFSR